MSAQEKRSVLFVCQGNICRSPLAEGVFNHLLRKHALDGEIRTDSAGTISFHSGEAPDARMTAVASAHGIPLHGHSRQFTPHDFREYDLILAMDRNNYRDILQMTTNESERKKVRMFLSFDPEQDDASSVPDPYYGGRQGFEEVFAMVERTCRALIARHQSATLFLHEGAPI